MRFAEPLIAGKLVRRYKRFLADVELGSGATVTVHTANPGRMLGLTRPGSTVYLSRHDKPTRKLPYTWELVRVGRTLVGVNPMLANGIVAEAIEAGAIAELRGYRQLRREVRYGSRGSRVDLLLSEPDASDCYVEVKSVTLVERSVAMFPDAVTERGRKHLLELGDMVAAGHRGVVCFLVQRRDARAVSTADHIDPQYADALREALSRGVEAIAYRASVGTRRIVVAQPLPVEL